MILLPYIHERSISLYDLSLFRHADSEIPLSVVLLLDFFYNLGCFNIEPKVSTYCCVFDLQTSLSDESKILSVLIAVFALYLKYN